ncbi:hypothetical protein C0995_004684 [Termitomyces sp. Mi166|nr:hypothetical protein C0995_004684 [Termitomyces sp. Mi166\
MPPAHGPIWEYFLRGKKQNESHVRAHCRGCIEKRRPNGVVVELDSDGRPALLSSDSWVIQACKEDVGGVRGVRESMIAHILGNGKDGPCPNTSSDARKAARQLKKGDKKRELPDADSDSDVDTIQKPAKKRMLTKVQASMHQSQLKVFQGPCLPFTSDQAGIVREQFLRATVSANLRHWRLIKPLILSRN